MLPFVLILHSAALLLNGAALLVFHFESGDPYRRRRSPMCSFVT
jgi:hypothetical protein